ncbi:gibberellin-regulated protein 1-like [Tasmannia lanceolata]|uniref:gibberellin-regulated protein 1-like n=1 Tax=Tasmannia lanceolata TaxID=3420 RepID=UPI004063C6FF
MASSSSYSIGFSPSMASSSTVFLLFLVLSILALHHVEANLGFDSNMLTTSVAGRSLLQRIDCGSACAVRCSLSRRPRLCKRACGTCCARCNCVPPGTSGNQDLCACYANMTTHGNRLKCP